MKYLFLFTSILFACKSKAQNIDRVRVYDNKEDSMAYEKARRMMKEEVSLEKMKEMREILSKDNYTTESVLMPSKGFTVWTDQIEPEESRYIRFLTINQYRKKRLPDLSI